MKTLKKVLDLIFPKSRIGNVIYLIIGLAISNQDAILQLIDAIKKLISNL